MAQKKAVEPGLPKLDAKFLVGKWKAVTAEAYNAPPLDELLKAVPEKDTTQKAASPSRGAGGTSAQQAEIRKRRNLENFVYYEKSSTLEIFDNKTAVKTYPARAINFTWKLKKNTIIAKDKKTKEKYKMEIIKYNVNDIQAIETIKAGQVRVHYTREVK